MVLTNYRKSGEIFHSLLSMRPIIDSNRVVRFCIGMQLEVATSRSLRNSLTRHAKLLAMLPRVIEVGDVPIVGTPIEPENDFLNAATPTADEYWQQMTKLVCHFDNTTKEERQSKKGLDKVSLICIREFVRASN